LEDLRAAAAAGAERCVGSCPVGQDGRHSGQRQHVVDDRGLAEEPFERRQRRLGTHDATAPLEALEHCGLFAADVRTGADAHVHAKREPTAQHVVAQPTVRCRGIDGGVQRRSGVGVLGPDVDVAVVCADCVAGDDHALDERHRVAFDQHAIGERAAVAFVGVAHDVLDRACGTRDRGTRDSGPLDARRERSAATTAQA
jgi:hypothetical protein